MVVFVFPIVKTKFFTRAIKIVVFSDKYRLGVGQLKKEDEEENHRAATVFGLIAECKSCLGGGFVAGGMIDGNGVMDQRFYNLLKNPETAGCLAWMLS